MRFIEEFIEKLNTPGAVVIVVLFFLALDGFLLYRYQQNFPPAGSGLTAFEETATTVDTAASENAVAERTDEPAEFVHRATSENIVNNSTYIDYPSANGNPNAILLVARGSQPSRAANGTRNIGVWYDAYRGDRWAVFNQDLAPIPEGTTFDVAVREEPGGAAFVHRATPENTTDNGTYVDHPLTNENPNAVLSIMPNWNPGGGAGTYVDHPVGVRYDADEEKWTILNQDLAPMPRGAAFNVEVS